MNKQINELVGKTLDSEFRYTWSTMDRDDLQRFSEKFSELVIKQCAEHILNTSDRYRKEYFAGKVLELLE
jgi:hypothetical protein